MSLPIVNSSLNVNYNNFQYSCHGVIWIAGWLAYCWFIDNKDLYQMQINMIFGLILDIIFVAVLKATVRRRRPTEDPYSLGPDKYSFPSGHASRAVFILCFFTMLHPITIFVWPSIGAWCVSVCLSRLILYRHHILDVLAGIFLGLFEALFLWIIWLEKDTAESIMKWISDDRNSQE